MRTYKFISRAVFYIFAANLLIACAGSSSSEQALNPENNLSESDLLALSNLTESEQLALNTITETEAVSTAMKSITLTWETPVKNVDNSCIASIDAYKVNYGTSSNNYSTTQDVLLSSGEISCTQHSYNDSCDSEVLTCSFTTTELPSDTWFFAIQAIDNNGYVSNLSNEAFQIIN